MDKQRLEKKLPEDYFVKGNSLEEMVEEIREKDFEVPEHLKEKIRKKRKK